MAINIDSYMCVIILTNGTVWQVRGSIISSGGIHRTGCTVIISCCAFVETLHTFSTYTISIEIFSRNTKSCKTSQSNYNSFSSGKYTILICCKVWFKMYFKSKKLICNMHNLNKLQFFLVFKEKKMPSLRVK